MSGVRHAEDGPIHQTPGVECECSVEHNGGGHFVHGARVAEHDGGVVAGRAHQVGQRRRQRGTVRDRLHGVGTVCALQVQEGRGRRPQGAGGRAVDIGYARMRRYERMRL